MIENAKKIWQKHQQDIDLSVDLKKRSNIDKISRKCKRSGQ